MQETLHAKISTCGSPNVILNSLSLKVDATQSSSTQRMINKCFQFRLLQQWIVTSNCFISSISSSMRCAFWQLMGPQVHVTNLNKKKRKRLSGGGGRSKGSWHTESILIHHNLLVWGVSQELHCTNLISPLHNLVPQRECELNKRKFWRNLELREGRHVWRFQDPLVVFSLSLSFLFKFLSLIFGLW